MQNLFRSNYNNLINNNYLKSNNLYHENDYYEFENRGNTSNLKKNKKKKNFKTLKNNTIHSLNDVEYFLNNLSQFIRGVKIYKLIKK
ncbi:MAG: hypothetical protein IJH76_03115 [Clostridia bacterium]|nr:hypothetical protein [Clostridia bacterium]